MLCCYVDELKDGILPYLEQILQTMIPSLEFYFHEDVARAAVASLPDLLRAGKLAVSKGAKDQAWFQQLVNHIIPPLIQAMAKEPDIEIQVRYSSRRRREETSDETYGFPFKTPYGSGDKSDNSP